MRFIYSLVAILIISSCGGGGSSTEIILNTEENSAEPCQNYVSINGSGKTFNCSVIHDEKNRQFFIYQGSSYSGNAPVLFVLHGYTSRALWIMNYSGFHSIADEFGFLVIYPQGTLLPSTGQTHWNVGGWTTSSTTDDVSFINSLINFIDDEYSIDPKRIYYWNVKWRLHEL